MGIKVDPEPEVQKPTEDDLKLKSMEENFVPKDVWAEIYSDLDDSVAVPEEFRDVYQWGRVRIDMDKYADLGICFEKAVAMAKSGDSDMSRYLGFIKNKYGKTTGDKQAWDLARYLYQVRRCEERWIQSCAGLNGSGHLLSASIADWFLIVFGSLRWC